MRTKKPFAFLPILILAVSLACSVLQPTAEPTSDGALQTEVRGTLTAAAPENGVTPTGEEIEATETPDSGTPAPGSVDLHIVYIKDGDVWLWTQAGGARQISTHGEVVDLNISDDGQVVAYLRRADEVRLEMWAVNADGTNERLLESVEALADMDPGAVAVVPHRMEWVPGSHVLAYNTRQVLEGPGLILYNDLRLVDADSLDHSTLLAPGDGGQFYYSPDGSQIAVSTPTDISLVDAGGTNRRDAVLTYEEVLTFSEYQYYARPLWSMDSSLLRVAIPPHDAMDPANHPTTLWEISTDGTPAVQLGQVTAAPFFGSEVQYAPDLEHILYLKQVGDPAANQHELHLASEDGSEDMVYHAAPLMGLEGWAPDSIHFVFYQGENRTPQLGMVGGGFEPLIPDAASILEIRWVDSNRFFYAEGGVGEEVWSLQLAALDGETTLIDEVSGMIPVVDLAGE